MHYESGKEANSIELVCFGVRDGIFETGSELHSIVEAALQSEAYGVLHDKQVPFDGGVVAGFTGFFIISESHAAYRARKHKSVADELSFLDWNLRDQILGILLGAEEEHDRAHYRTYAENGNVIDFNINTYRGSDAGWIVIDHLVRALEPEEVYAFTKTVPVHREAATSLPYPGCFFPRGKTSSFLSEIEHRVERNRVYLKENSLLD